MEQRKGFPFKVLHEKQAVRFAKEFEHVVIDTQARPTEEDLKAPAEGCRTVWIEPEIRELKDRGLRL